MKRDRRISRTAADWKRIVSEWTGSGESQREYCARRGIGLSSFIRWRRLLKRERPKPGGDAFIPLGPMAAPVIGGSALVIRLPGEVELVLSRMPDAEWLRRVLKA